MNRMSSVESWLQQEDEYVRQFDRPPTDLDRDFCHQLIQFSALSNVRLQQGLNQSDKLKKLHDQVGRLMTDLVAVVQERDQRVEDASKIAEEHWLRVVEVQATCEAFVVESEKDVVAATEKNLVASFLPSFEECLKELKDDHDIECKTVKHGGFWKVYVHRQDMCNLVHPPLVDLAVPQSLKDWDTRKATAVPTYQPPVDASEREEENLKADFPEYTDPPSL